MINKKAILKIIFLLKLIKIFPTNPFFPQISNKKNPITVGGNIRGRVKTPSISPLPLPL